MRELPRAEQGACAWSRPNRSIVKVLTFYSEGFVRTAYAAHCIQRGTSRLALVSSKVCWLAPWALLPFVVSVPFQRFDRWR
jgi:hypothetical protein